MEENQNSTQQKHLNKINKLKDEINILEDNTSKDIDYKNLILAIPNFIIVHANNKILFVNGLTTTKAGYSETELIGSNLFTYIHKDDHENVIATQAKRLKRESYQDAYTLRLINKMGEVLYFEARTSNVFFRQKNATLVVLTEITDKIATERALRNMESTFSAFMEKIPAKTFIKDNKGKFLYINKQWPELFGNQKSWIGKNIREILNEDLSQERILSDTEALEKGISFAEEEHIDQTGKKRFFKTAKFRIDIDSGNHNIGGVAFETTDLKRIEFNLKKQKIYFQRLVESMPEAIAILKNNKVLDINPEFENLFQYKLEEIRNKDITELIVPEEITDESSEFLKQVQDNRPVKAESIRKKKNGDIVDVSILGAPILIEGKINAIVVIYRNISDRKNQERKIKLQNEALESANEELSSINDELSDSRSMLINTVERLQLTQFSVNEAHEAIYWFDKNSNICYANKAALEMLGYNKYEILKKSALTIDTNFTHENWKIHWDKVKETGATKFESLHRRKDGSFVSVEMSSSYINYKNKQLIVSYASDISERKKTEKHLKENEELFRSLVSTTASGLLIYQGLKLKYVNKAAEIITGYSTADIQSMDFLDIIHPDYWHVFEKQNLEILGDENSITGFELKIITKSKEEKWIDIRGNIISYEGKKGGVFSFFDISNKKQAEEALRSSEAKYRHIFNQSPIGIVHFDQLGNITDCNDKFSEILSSEKQNLIGLNLQKQINSEDIENAVHTTLKGNSSFYKGSHFTNTSNKKIIISLYVKPIFDTKNKITGGLALIEDITIRHNAEKMLKQTLAEKDVIINTLPDVLYIISTKGVFIDFYTNNVSRALLSKEKLIGKNISEMMSVETVEIMLKKIRQAVSTKKLQSFEYSDKINGEIKYLEIRLALINHNEVLTIVRDITDKKIAEVKLQETNNLIEQERNIFINGPVMVFKWRNLTNWNIEYASPNVDMILGYKSSQFSIKKISFLQLVFDSDIEKVQKEVTASLASETTHFTINPFRIKSKEGNIYWVNLYINVVKEANNKHYLGYVVDITNQKLAEEEVIAKNKELEDFLYVTSHDIRSPLVNIQGFSKEIEFAIQNLNSMLLEYSNILEYKEKASLYFDSDIPESLNYIYKSTEKMENLLTGLLKLSRMGRFALKLEHIDMEKLCKDAIATFEFITKEQDIDINLGTMPSCEADRNMLNQVISNLIDNAIKYQKANTKGIIKIAGYIEGEHCIYKISDNGIGIKPQEQTKIFGLFQRFNRNIDGEGIGLTMIKKIIERHKGSIWVDSEYTKGSTFYFSINRRLRNLINN